MVNSGIYQIINTTTNKRYIGSSQNLVKRLQDHIGSLYTKKHHSRYLQRAWDKYGPSSFKFHSIEICPIDKLIEREQYWIDFYEACNPENGYNSAPKAGSMLGNKHSEETKEKLKVAWVYEKHVTPEMRAKLSKSLKGRVVTEETRKKISQAHKGRILSEERCKMISNFMKGKVPWNKDKKQGPQSPELVEKRIAPLRGKCRSEEVRRKISESNKGKKFSDETKKKMSLAHIGVPMPEEKRRKIGETLRGRKCSEEHKRNVGLANLGKKRTEEAKEKMKLAWIRRKNRVKSLVLN